MISVSSIFKDFMMGESRVPVLRGVDLEVEEGEFLIIFGTSGCGKSTLLHAIMGLEPPTSGDVRVDGQHLYSMSEDKRADWRKEHLGIILQQVRWVQSLNVLENVSFPLVLLGESFREASKKAQQRLEHVGMLDRQRHRPMELSMGQQQLVSLARAMITDPKIIIADEPTGNLDYAASQKLVHTLTQSVKENKTLLMVTHDRSLLKFTPRAVHLREGKIWKEYKETKRRSVEKQILAEDGGVEV